jgi:phosphopantetheinyl transferase (holo-ACP synthase)
MLGNDVVDLAHPSVQPGAQHPRFDARVFSERERAQLARADASSRWTYWAAKEAAYKAAKKRDRAVVWAPARFEVSLDTERSGRVLHAGRELALRVERTPQWVHALADDVGTPLAIECGAVGALAGAGDDASARVRALACSELARRLGVAVSALEIVTRERVPALWIDGAPARADLSLSHHGRFVAYACALDVAAAPLRRAS